MQQNHDVMTVEDVAVYIKMSISYIYKNLDKIPHKRVGGNIRFHKPTIDHWLAQSSVVPIMDADKEAIAQMKVRNAMSA
jgi:excisionase family DNA binding protein